MAGDPKTEPRRTRAAKMGDVASRLGALEPSDPMLRRALHVGIAVALLLGVGLAVLGSANELPDVDWRWRPLSLGLGIAGFAIFMLASAELWRQVLEALGPRLGRGTAIRIWFVSGLGRYVPTSLLLPMVRVAACRRQGVAQRITFASIVYEFALAMSAAVIVGAYSLISLPSLQDEPERWAVLAVPVVILIALHPKVFRPLADWGLNRIGREPLPTVLAERDAARLLLLYFFVYAMAGVAVYLLAQSVYPVGSGDIVTVTGAYALGTVLGVIAFALPAGLVAREAGVAVGLAPVMPASPAIAIAILARVVQIAVEVAITSISLARGRLSEPAADAP